MIRDYIPLDPKRHGFHGWKRNPDYFFAAGHTRVASVLAELPYLLPQYPFAFVQSAAGQFELTALLGLYEGENVFVDTSGRWFPAYIPVQFRAYPFVIMQGRQEDKTVNLIGFDQGSGLLLEHPDPIKPDEMRFYDDERQPLPMLQQVMSLLSALLVSERQTRTAIDALTRHGLIVPWQLTVDPRDAKHARLEGLFKIDESRLATVSGDVLQALRDDQALYLAYAQIFSMTRLAFLQQLSELRGRLNARKTKQALPTSLDAFFGEGQPEILRFDGLFGK